MTKGLTIAQMNLAPVAHGVAVALLAACPDVVFTSGRRTVDDQARAMAQNLVHDRAWIRKTYIASPEVSVLQLAAYALPDTCNVAEIAEALAKIMRPWSDVSRAHVSKHFSGEAFDLHPLVSNGRPTPRGVEICAVIRALPGVAKFLTKEGGLDRWHVQT